LSCQVENPILQEIPFCGKEILTVAGVTREIRESIYLGIPMVSALKIVSILMGGAAVLGFDPMAQSTIDPGFD